MRSESTSALGQPSETKLTCGGRAPVRSGSFPARAGASRLARTGAKGVADMVRMCGSNCRPPQTVHRTRTSLARQSITGRIHPGGAPFVWPIFGRNDKMQDCHNPRRRRVFVPKGAERLNLVYEITSHLGGSACRRALTGDNTPESTEGR